MIFLAAAALAVVALPVFVTVLLTVAVQQPPGRHHGRTTAYLIRRHQ